MDKLRHAYFDERDDLWLEFVTKLGQLTLRVCVSPEDAREIRRVIDERLEGRK